MLPDTEIAFGAEFNEFEHGLKDSYGNNFIVNEEVQRIGIGSDQSGGFSIIGSVNDYNTWVKPNTVSMNSAFLRVNLHCPQTGL